ncbi:hypothetical protein ACIRD6_34145 [Streptomyces sp. NPDC102473]|uniref:hypothetical protein n=1 Tax=Streptomyces sp. NPDC102473 TaxID=3366180 RepID=UPI00382EDDE1
MMFSLFTRRPAPVAPVDVPAATRRPECGETWSPAGVSVAQRYYNQAHAVVLVYTAYSPDRHYVACLGCPFTKVRDLSKDWTSLGLNDAAEIANAHAATCHALPRDLPAGPNDDAVREHLRKWVEVARNRVEEVEIWVEALDPARLTLQRTDDWIEAALRELAHDEPSLLLVRTSEGARPRFFARHCIPVS